MDHCADHDPLLCAPEFLCGDCKTATSPVDAEWITVTQILVTYEYEHGADCPRGYGATESWTVLTDLTSSDVVYTAPTDNAWRARDHYHIQATGYPIGTPFCGVCGTVLERGAWWCDEHRCRATARSTGSRCGHKSKYDGLCRVHHEMAAR